ncbi:MAG: HNH endonuclease [Vibrio sp.]|uniref:HNH endonuclease n=1 Tax=Vibrio sp. TaxID=678 RepID=UPI003A8A67D3
MIKLSPPEHTINDAIQLCTDGMSKKDLKDRIYQGSDEIRESAADYCVKAEGGELFTIDPIEGDEESVVNSGVSKREFVNLYEYYFRNTKKPGREIYDALMLSADESCPFCGGIGRPKNLDHYLPKAHFPQFSILPFNLIPSCRDCNMDGKGEHYATAYHEQIIHPYLDKECFFQEQWVFAQVLPGSPCALDFYVSPPEEWEENDKLRAEQHFIDFDLSKRYSIQAANLVTFIVTIRSTIMNDSTAEEFKAFLSSYIDSPLFINHWQVVSCQALANSDWFCTEGHL